MNSTQAQLGWVELIFKQWTSWFDLNAYEFDLKKKERKCVHTTSCHLLEYQSEITARNMEFKDTSEKYYLSNKILPLHHFLYSHWSTISTSSTFSTPINTSKILFKKHEKSLLILQQLLQKEEDWILIKALDFFLFFSNKIHRWL